ncbi:MAG: tetratricopeptide repeat protein [Bacteroidota bacterium]
MPVSRLERLLQFLEEDPNDAFTLFALAQEYTKLGDPTQATALYERLVNEQPEYVGTYYHLGKIYEEADRFDEAVEIYQRGIVAATQAGDLHAKSELQSALMDAQIGGL